MNYNTTTIKQLKSKLKQHKSSISNLHSIIAKQEAILQFLKYYLENFYKKISRAEYSEDKLPKWAKSALSDLKYLYNSTNQMDLISTIEQMKIDKIHSRLQNKYTITYKYFSKNGTITRETYPTIYIATNNANKYDVFKDIFKDTGITIRSQGHIPFTKPVKEDGKTYYENALKKALYLSEITKGWVIADDSGLEVDAINGLPGVHSSRYAHNKATDKENVDKLLEELQMVYTGQPVTATYKCTLVVAFNGKFVTSFTGELPGTIRFTAKGTNGWSYDSIFCPEGFDDTLASLPTEIQKHISHRYIACMRFISWFKQLSW